MALAPARLLLPMRGVEAPHPSTLSSASVCSATGAYPHFSSLFFPSHGQRSGFSVSAGVVEAHDNGTYKPSHHTPFRRHADENFFDDTQSSNPEVPFVPRSRDFNGGTRSERRYSRPAVDNGSRRTWESGNFPPWKKRGSSAEFKVRHNKPPDSYRRFNSYTSTSYAEAGAVEAFNQPTVGATNSKRLNYEQREWESNNYAKPRKAYQDNKRVSREQQVESAHGGVPMFQSSRERKFSNIFSSRDYQGNPELRMNSSDTWISRVGSLSNKDHQLDLQHGSHASCAPNRVMNSQPSPQSSFLSQSIAKERSWEERKLPINEAQERRLSGMKLDVQKEEEKENIAFSGSPSISKIIERLRNIEDRIPSLHAREDLPPTSERADDLALPSARDYLSDRTPHMQAREQLEKNAPGDTRFPWERGDTSETMDSFAQRARKSRPLSQVELTISGPELRRLRILAVYLKQRVKIGKHGVTNDAVDSIQKRFRTCEVVKVKVEGPPAGNMRKTLETLEEKTGGFIIWKAGSIAVLYRGQHYGQPVSEIVDDLLAKKYENLTSSRSPQPHASRSHALNEVVLSKGQGKAVDADPDTSADTAVEQDGLDFDANFKGRQLDPDTSVDTTVEHDVQDSNANNVKRRSGKRSKNAGPEFESLEAYVLEVDDILKDLGPRYTDWTGPNPVPVDADLLPKNIPNYVSPYRLLPYGMKPGISNTYATHLRRLSRPLAPHFIIGRDRGLQGLAVAMIKLWEKSEIAKIGVKRGVLNTNHERIAEELKLLTGGFFLCRDKNSMTFYRGKDFLPPTISGILADRQTRAEGLQVEEERARTDGSVNITTSLGSSEFLPSWVQTIDPEEQIQLKREAARARRVQLIAHLERKIQTAMLKKKKAGIQLEKVEKSLQPIAPTDDKEILTDEERFMLKKLGLKMKAFLLLGRRGVFSGVVQNMHLHWKHRELVKIVVKERDPVQLAETARMVAAESGGILISVDPTSKGFAIVVYRGKNYARPPELRPPNLLTKRLALHRSLEIQRRQSLSQYMEGLEKEIIHLRAGLSKMKLLDSANESLLDDQSAISDSSMTNDSIPGDVVLESSSGHDLQKLSRQKLRNLCEVGPIFRAVRFSKLERHQLRSEVLKLGKAPHFLVGRTNPMSTIAKAIRLYFLDHAFVKVGVNYRPRGSSVQDVVEELEDLTGGAAYAQDDFRVILYRGWPSGKDIPLDGLYDVLSPEQLDILEEEEVENEDDEGMVEDDRDYEEAMTEESITSAAEIVGEGDLSDEGEENMDAGMSSWVIPDEEDLYYGGMNNQLRSESTRIKRLESDEEEESNAYENNFDEEMLPLDMSGDDEDASNDGEDRVRLARNLESSDDERYEEFSWDEYSEELGEDEDEAQLFMMSGFSAGNYDD